jgi:hypothetical protein
MSVDAEPGCQPEPEPQPPGADAEADAVTGPDVHTFRCNICGGATASPRTAFGRESASCHVCGSTVRMRSIVHGLAVELFGECLAIEDLPVHPEIRRSAGSA